MQMILDGVSCKESFNNDDSHDVRPESICLGSLALRQPLPEAQSQPDRARLPVPGPDSQWLALVATGNWT